MTITINSQKEGESPPDDDANQLFLEFCRTRNPEIFESWVRLKQKMIAIVIRRYAYNASSEDIEEEVDNLITELFCNAPTKYDSRRASPETYVRYLAKRRGQRLKLNLRKRHPHLSLNAQREDADGNQVLLFDEPVSPFDMLDNALTDELWKDLQKQLNPQELDVLKLRLYGLTSREISKCLPTSYDNVRQILRRLRDKLDNYLALSETAKPEQRRRSKKL